MQGPGEPGSLAFKAGGAARLEGSGFAGESVNVWCFAENRAGKEAGLGMGGHSH